MDVFNAYTFGTAGWLTLQALPLLVAPKAIVSLLSEDMHRTTDLEIYFCRSLAFALLVVALIMMFFTGSIPLSLSTSEPISLEDSDPKAPYAVPIVRVATIYHAVALLYSYGSYVNSGRVGFVLGAIGSGAMAAMGIWCVMFGTETGRFSKRTGADKRTSGFPFKNDKAYNPKKDRKMK